VQGTSLPIRALSATFCCNVGLCEEWSGRPPAQGDLERCHSIRAARMQTPQLGNLKTTTAKQGDPIKRFSSIVLLFYLAICPCYLAPLDNNHGFA